MNEQNDDHGQRTEYDDDYLNANRKARARRSGNDRDWNRSEARYGADEFGAWNRDGNRFQDSGQHDAHDQTGGYQNQEQHPGLRHGQQSGYQGGANYGQGSTARHEGHSQNFGGRWNGEQSNYGQHNYGVQRNYAQRQGFERQAGGGFSGYGEDRERFQSSSYRSSPSHQDERIFHPDAVQGSMEHRGSGRLYPPERPTQSSPASIYGRQDIGQASSFGSQPANSFSGQGPKGYQRSDERVREEVCDALTDHHDIDASDIEVRVESGEVTLSGTVTSRREKRLAEDALEGVRGVRDVNNQLRVRTESSNRATGSNVAMTAKDTAGAAVKKTEKPENRLNS